MQRTRTTAINYPSTDSRSFSFFLFSSISLILNFFFCIAIELIQSHGAYITFRIYNYRYLLCAAFFIRARNYELFADLVRNANHVDVAERRMTHENALYLWHNIYATLYQIFHLQHTHSHTVTHSIAHFHSHSHRVEIECLASAGCAYTLDPHHWQAAMLSILRP